ncbi:hypothetical protein BC941DRAFT_452605 [Chlamydoabsidia padenii]|nr:hypothetical protein BC941DRAFT_452605 [Chlamydoabsidia padenii]
MVRYWHSGTPHFITQSELLLAQEINWTLKGQFYIGSSPPLATLMYSFVANCLGYHGVESILYAGQTLHEFPLTSLRQLTMFISALVIPVIYTLMRVVGCAHTTALFTCGLFVFDFVVNVGRKQVPKWIGIPSFTLMILPITIYISLFQWHFYHVPNAGDHDFFLSSSLRYSLNGNTFEPVQQYIAYGSHVVLKHVSSNNGYLHSDDKIFEGGSNQNQVTVYPYEDMNNIWVIQKLDGKTYADKDPEYLYNNNAFKLEHYASTRKLHSHDHKAPVHTGEGFYEVTAKTTVSSWVFEYAHHPKFVYDRLSSVPPDETEPTDTMMYSGREPQPFHWLKSTYAYLIWDDLTGRSVLVVLHPMLRYLTLSALALFPLIAVFSAFAFQLHWSHSMIWCQEFWSNRHIKSATMMLGGVLIHAIGVMICPPHTFQIKNIDCEKYPAIVPDLTVSFDDDDGPISVMDPQLIEGADHPQENHDLESRHIMMPGTPLRFEYERGQEMRAEMEIAKVRENAYREAVASLIKPAHRFVRATFNQGPTLEEITQFNFTGVPDSNAG